MTIATPERYLEMLDAARQGGYAYPAINVTSTQTLNAALQGFAEADSDGIIQVSVGGAAYLSGQRINDRVTGSLAFAAFARQVAARYPHITVALHTDHCSAQYLDTWVRPLMQHETRQVARGEQPAFQSHMWDGSALPLDKNLDVAALLLREAASAHTVLEIEVGAVGGEEDGHVADSGASLYSTPDDARQVARRLGLWRGGKDMTSVAPYMAAFTFGNAHGAYKPGVVKLHPELLGEIQDALGSGQSAESTGVARPAGSEGPVGLAGSAGAPSSVDKPFALVFHGGSGSSLEQIRQAVSYGVVKMNIDTDTQYAFTRAVAGHMFKHYDDVLKLDGAVGDKQYYDPRSWGREAESAMARRVVEACVELGSAGKARK
ncbi:fructose-bisphosphate aldolase [Bifidobacterium bohemicum]|uniref:Fructose-bisphosphate aldolase n=1 Tax=Bifidobacterium bohemicum DSM 22767 TaxID=1437606 RepID=A0A086ZHG5_9BIFI|nr:class II fructose-bisphosphate aldolase [Bifidobacterium bohemicum]KFI45965.1 fructose-bisphosphate aldolase, class II [Bifidobacterium bohemicum DSM 22767]SCC13930.1 fructose-bisphosphate aldolase [Bifidobacterium bohemicum]